MCGCEVGPHHLVSVSSDSPEEGRESGREGERKGGRGEGREGERVGGKEVGREGRVNGLVSQQ